ncbi:MAG: ADP-dependent glucokinase/phosphofructokinase [Lachnospiraceae bacterium]|nr:ADP-dependent glucokinase/phosphofructokinase [Lachnospiraceae bacterium]
MAYQDRYRQYLDEIPQDVKNCYSSGKRHVMAYTSNYDVVLNWDVDTYNQILKKYLKEEPSVNEGDTIKSMEDFARISSYYLLRGIGGNFDITEVEVCEYLKDKFVSEAALGGTCAQGAAALGAMGFPVNVQITDKSKEVCELMNYQGMSIIKEDQMVPIMDGATEESPIYHFILQFSKDDKVVIGDKEYIIPVSNRLILFYDKLQKIVPISKTFIKYWNTHAADMYSYLASGFDAIVDLEIMKERLSELEMHYIEMRKRNPGFVFYFEGAFYMNPLVKELASDVISKYADILGMNEEELVAQVGRFDVTIDVSQLEEVFKGLDIVLDKYPVKGVVLHTKDYSMYYGMKMEDIDIEKGLTIGNIMSGTRARIGRYGTKEECIETLSLPLSNVGIEFSEQIDRMNLKKFVCVVPSRYLERPKYTIGLGDTFVAGVHTCFVK